MHRLLAEQVGLAFLLERVVSMMPARPPPIALA